MTETDLNWNKENNVTPEADNADLNGNENQASFMCEETSNAFQLQDVTNHRSPLDLSNFYNGNKNDFSYSLNIELNDDKYTKLWQCKTCNKQFSHQYTLMRHLPTHTDERKFQCKICGKAFRQMSTLSQHRAIHSLERPYVCEVCHKTFNRISTLISHRKTHTGIKPHQCHICNKAFHQKGNLRNHIYTHTNARPYKCDECGKGYNQMSNLMCHKSRSHRDSAKPKYFCEICGQYFTKRSDFRNHEQIKHEINSFSIVQNNLRDNQKVSNAIFVEPIRTKAMQLAIESNQIPFALLKPLNGIAVLVRVLPAGDKQMLLPASAEDLKKYGTISIIPYNEVKTDDKECNKTPNSTSSTNSNTVKIKIPVVATVIQENSESGQITLSVVSPGPQDNDDTETIVDQSISDTSFIGTENRKCIVEDGAVVISKNENLNSTEVSINN